MAVLLETKTPEQLAPLILTRVQWATAATAAAQKVEGQVSGLAYRGVTTPDRRVCSYIASSAGMVIVTNSLSQLARRITGTPWNGFLFFGLQRRTQPDPVEEARG